MNVSPELRDALEEVRNFLRTLPQGGPPGLAERVRFAVRQIEREMPTFNGHDPLWLDYVQAANEVGNAAAESVRNRSEERPTPYTVSRRSLDAAVLALIERGPWRDMEAAPKLPEVEGHGPRIIGWGKFGIARKDEPERAVFMEWINADAPGWYAIANGLWEFLPRAWRPMLKGP